jgi:hypothetical protein
MLPEMTAPWIRTGMVTLGVSTLLALGAGDSGAEDRGNGNPTTAGSSSSTTTPNPDCEVSVRLYNAVELTALSFTSGVFSCRSEIPGVVVTRQPSGYFEVTNFPLGFRGPADLLTCFEEIHHSDCEPFLEDYGFYLIAYGGPGGELPEPPELCAARIECDHYNCSPRTARVAGICGDADDNGAVRAIDALAILRASVDLQECPAVLCDADRDDENTATDAQLVLRASVGIDALLVCPPPCEPPSPG